MPAGRPQLEVTALAVRLRLDDGLKPREIKAQFPDINLGSLDTAVRRERKKRAAAAAAGGQPAAPPADTAAPARDAPPLESDAVRLAVRLRIDEGLKLFDIGKKYPRLAALKSNTISKAVARERGRRKRQMQAAGLPATGSSSSAARFTAALARSHMRAAVVRAAVADDSTPDRKRSRLSNIGRTIHVAGGVPVVYGDAGPKSPVVQLWLKNKDGETHLTKQPPETLRRIDVHNKWWRGKFEEAFLDCQRRRATERAKPVALRKCTAVVCRFVLLVVVANLF